MSSQGKMLRNLTQYLTSLLGPYLYWFILILACLIKKKNPYYFCLSINSFRLLKITPFCFPKIRALCEFMPSSMNLNELILSKSSHVFGVAWCPVIWSAFSTTEVKDVTNLLYFI